MNDLRVETELMDVRFGLKSPESLEWKGHTRFQNLAVIRPVKVDPIKDVIKRIVTPRGRTVRKR